MAFSVIQGPPGGAAIVGQALKELMPHYFSTNNTTGGAPPASAQASQPLQVFNVKLDAINDEHFLASAVPIGWRYLIVQDKPVGIADIGQDTAGSPAFKRFTQGIIPLRLAQAALSASRSYENDQSVFEVRLLEIPALYSSALWLHGPRDIFIPFFEGGSADMRPPVEDPAYIQRITAAGQKRRLRPIQSGP